MNHRISVAAIARLILSAVLVSGTVSAIEHPACAGKDNRACDTFGMLLNLKGKGCYRLLKVEPLEKGTYILTCELASTNRSKVTYQFRFVDGEKDYVVR